MTLAWASINMIGLDSLDGLDDGTMVHLWSYLMFTLYHGISMIVMLNMLIAMMSNSYQQMEVSKTDDRLRSRHDVPKILTNCSKSLKTVEILVLILVFLQI